MTDRKNPDYKESATQKKILDAACEEFAEYGLAGARVDRLARRAGVNKAMIYYHFGSKEKLYQMIIDQHLERIRQIAQAADSGTRDIDTLIMNLARGMAMLFDGREKFIPILLREMASGGEYFKKRIVKVVNESGYTNMISNLISDGKKQGILRDVDTKQAIATFLGINIFYQLMAPIFNAVWEVKNEDDFRERRPGAAADIFLNGIKAK